MEEILNLLFDFKIHQNYSSLKYLVLFVVSIQSRKEKKTKSCKKQKPFCGSIYSSFHPSMDRKTESTTKSFL